MPGIAICFVERFQRVTGFILSGKERSKLVRIGIDPVFANSFCVAPK